MFGINQFSIDLYAYICASWVFKPYDFG